MWTACVASFGGNGLSRDLRKSSFSRDQVPNRSYCNALTKRGSALSRLRILDSCNLWQMAALKIRDWNENRPLSNKFGIGWSWRKSPTMIICFPPNAFDLCSDTDTFWCMVLTNSKILALDVLILSHMTVSTFIEEWLGGEILAAGRFWPHLSALDWRRLANQVASLLSLLEGETSSGISTTNTGLSSFKLTQGAQETTIYR